MNNLSKYRLSAEPKLSQARLAAKAGLSQPTVSELERGAKPELDNARAIVVALNSFGVICTLDDVFPPLESQAA